MYIHVRYTFTLVLHTYMFEFYRENIILVLMLLIKMVGVWHVVKSPVKYKEVMATQQSYNGFAAAAAATCIDFIALKKICYLYDCFKS